MGLLFRNASERKLGVIILMDGTNLPGIKRISNRLSRILDPRHFEVPEQPPAAFQENQPPLTYFWRVLPRRGNAQLIERSYYHYLTGEILRKRTKKKTVKKYLQDFQSFEKTLNQNDYIVIKIFLHKPKHRLRKRYKEDIQGSPREKLLGKRMKHAFKNYKRYTRVFGYLRDESAGHSAPWFIPPPYSTKKVTEAAVLDYLIATLEKKMQVDSNAEVVKFDQAMSNMRKLKTRAGDKHVET